MKKIKHIDGNIDITVKEGQAVLHDKYIISLCNSELNIYVWSKNFRTLKIMIDVQNLPAIVVSFFHSIGTVFMCNQTITS